MFFIPGWLVSVITFPGVIVHEIAHQLFCKLYRVAVFDVCYFRFGNPAGYVVHEQPRTPGQSIMISVGPFLLNTVVGALIAMPASISVLEFNSGDPVGYFLIWLGISIAMHAFPSRQDASSMWSSIAARETSPIWKVVAAPIVAIIWIGSFGSIVWLDALYGAAVALAIPKLLIAAMS